MEYKWLEHLSEDIIPQKAIGDKLSMYSVALEGWRRGLELTFFLKQNVDKKNRPEVRFSLRSKEREHEFAVSKGDLVSVDAMRVCNNKELTKETLVKAGVPVPEGKSFDKEINNGEILSYARQLGFPVVLKPTNANLGRGVIANIKSVEELEEALIHVREELGYSKVIVERYFVGEEYRVYVLNGKVLAATHRSPANIIGDGKSKIRDLIKAKNRSRKSNPNLGNRPIKIDAEVERSLKNSGYTLNSVLDKGERLYLREKSNLSSGGEPIDVTEELTPKMREAASNATKAVPNLPQCGVDMMVNKENNTCVIIELNTRPGIGAHLFPMEGTAKDIPKAIIDFYFPETIGKRAEFKSGTFYFDFDTIYNVLISGVTNKVIVPELPDDSTIVRAFAISGKVQGVGYRKWIQRHALALGLYGFVENLANENVCVVIAGVQTQVDKFVHKLNTDSPPKAKVKSVEEAEWKEPLKIGFEIRDRFSEENFNTLKKEYREVVIENQVLSKSINKVEKEKKKVEKRLRSIEQSRIWRYSRYLGRLIKKGDKDGR